MKTLSNAGTPEYPDLPKSENNQAQAISREDLAWLAGFIDGEGCIGVYRQWKKNDRDISKHGKEKWMTMRTNISISNNNIITLEKASRIYHALNLTFYYLLKTRTNPNHKTSLGIYVSGLGSCKKLLNSIYPYLSGKKEETDTMLEYIDLRLKKINESHRNCHSDAIKYAEQEETLLNRLKKLKDKEINPQRLQRKASQPIRLETMV